MENGKLLKKWFAATNENNEHSSIEKTPNNIQSCRYKL